MRKFDNTRLLLVEAALSHIGGYLQSSDGVSKSAPDRGLYENQAKLWELHFEGLADLDIPMTRLALERYIQQLRDPQCSFTMAQIQEGGEDVRRRFYDELEARGKFFYIPMSRASLFEALEPFGPRVSKKFPRLTEDIQEAHKCYACGRFTACVFHLMRIMEYSVQRLGSKLKVTIDVNTATWQIILNHVSGAIKPLNHKLKRTKRLAEIASHLYNVKLAWRNEVMHPKATYTEEEAELLLAQVGAYLLSLAEVL